MARRSPHGALHRAQLPAAVVLAVDHRPALPGFARINEEFDNGRHYYALHGASIVGPTNDNLRASPAALAWHNDNRYRG